MNINQKIKIFRLLFVFSGMVIGPLASLGQAPVLSQSWLPSAGDKYYLYRLDNQNPSTANDTGANVTWDFSDLYFGVYPSDSFDFATPASRNITCVNGASNLATGNPYNHGCYIKNSGGLYLTETKYSNPSDSTDIIYTKPSLFMKAGFHFRQEIFDTSKVYYFYHEPNQPAQTDSPFRGISYSYWKYDGYGILKLPLITYDSAIRIHIISYSADTSPDLNFTYNNNNHTDSLRFILDIYEWYVPSIHIWVLSMAKATSKNWTGGVYDTVGQDNVLYMAVSADTCVPGQNIQFLEHTQASYSNDAITLNGITYNTLDYVLYDDQGKLIGSGQPVLTGNGKAIIPTNASDLSQGIYLLRVQNSKGQTKTFRIFKN